MVPDDEQQFSPDGLTEDVIDALLAQVADELAELPPATSALLDGSARTRRDRRVVERQLGGTVRVLRVHGLSSGSVGTEAA
ncbi:hypothetical protein [Saccharothrix sp.]|uniref:hypothetical protein n=1 Tax=Saccharothrix sp. TaxID=1873460 RepID=UPI002810BD36|nr:hypothetical protein [Saccharothrix sp.]